MKKILITGARRGIGRDSAIALAKRGHDVIATVYREESVNKLRSYARKHDVLLTIFKLDVTKEADRNRITEFDIDVLINNAAVGQSGSLSEIPLERVRHSFETNVFAVLGLTQLALRQMIKKDLGQVINVSSLAGRIVIPFWGPYCMTKFALSSGTDVLRQELKMITKNIHISLVEPGAYHTGFNQDSMNTKYSWMNESSYFFNKIKKIKKGERSYFNRYEMKSTKTIVSQVIRAVEDKKPKLHYTAPWWQALYIQILRILGR